MYKVATRDRSPSKIRDNREKRIEAEEKALQTKLLTQKPKKAPKPKFNYLPGTSITSKTKKQRPGFMRVAIELTRYSGAKLREIRADSIHR